MTIATRKLRPNSRAGRKPKTPTLPEKELQPLKVKFEEQYERLYNHYRAIDAVMLEIYTSVAKLHDANLSQKAISEIVGTTQQWVWDCLHRAAIAKGGATVT